MSINPGSSPNLPIEGGPPIPHQAHLSFAQERLWLLDQIDPGNPAYHVAGAIHLSGQLNQMVLQQALELLLQRHLILRTAFQTVGGRPVQVVLAVEPVSLEVQIFQNAPATTKATGVQQWIDAKIRQPFDLAQGKLIQWALARLDTQEHILLQHAHPIICDEISLEILASDLAQLYTACLDGSATQLPALTVSYAEFATRQRKWLQGATLIEQIAFWEQRLGKCPSAVELPTDRPRPALQTFQAERQPLTFPPHLSQAAKDFSTRQGTSIFAVCLAAFQALLYRYTEQSEILIGTPVACRAQSSVAGVVGPFANTLVLRNTIACQTNFQDLVSNVHATLLDAYAHQELPFATVVDAIRPERDLSRNPLFQIMFEFQEKRVCERNLPTLQLRTIQVETTAIPVDLNLRLTYHGQELTGWLKYNSDLFTSATIQRMGQHFQNLFAEMIAEPARPLSELPILTKTEQHQTLVQWNRTQAPYAQNDCLHTLFEAQVKRTPDATAVTSPGKRLTFTELNRQANQLALLLKEYGVGPDTPVGIYMERSAQTVIGVLGVLKAGGAYVPLDPAYPEKRLAFMRADSQARIIVTQHKLVGKLSETLSETPDHTIVCLDGEEWETRLQTGPGPENLPNTAKADDPAYIIYTSGSTGTPKGVLGLHRGAVNRCEWMWKQYPFDMGERACQKTALSFVDSVWEIFGPLLQGIPLVIIPDESVKDPAQLIQVLKKERISRIVLVPSLLSALLDTQTSAEGQLPDLKYCISSGEAIPLELCQRFQHQMPGCILLNLYGSSEAAADATWFDTRQLDTQPSVPIGRPIANMKAYLLDGGLQPVAVGMPGELYVSGDGLARGYHHRPDLTAERFIPDSFASQPGMRLYKTGDRARLLPDGKNSFYLEFLGRSDHQVKIRGVRIELGEIEAVLAQHDNVRTAVAQVYGAQPDNKRLAAYIVARHTPPPTERELRSFLAGKLPESMIPATFLMLSELPLTPNGKLDRRALPAPELAQQHAAFVAPRTPVEEQLAAIWADVLGLERVSIHDNFFELGGYSLKATQVMSRVRDAFQIELPPLHSLFEAPSVAELAALIAQKQAEQTDPAILEQVLLDVMQLSPDELQLSLSLEK